MKHPRYKPEDIRGAACFFYNHEYKLVKVIQADSHDGFMDTLSTEEEPEEPVHALLAFLNNDGYCGITTQHADGISDVSLPISDVIEWVNEKMGRGIGE